MPGFRLEKFDIATTYKGLKSFDCDNEMINTFVQKSLKKRVKKHLSQAYVLLDKEDDNALAGFYTLDTFSIARDAFETGKKPSGLPPVVPVVKLGMLGVSKKLQGEGIGKRLLRDALRKVVQISELAGCAGLYLLAETDAISFYEKLGFAAIKDAEPLPMFLATEVIVDALKSQ